MAEAKKGRGCFFYGCLTLAIIVVIGIIAIFFIGRFFTKAFLDRTSSTGAAIAPITLPMRQGEDAIKRVDDFADDLDKGKAVGPLTLTSEELDYYLRNSAGGAPFHDRMHFTITNNHVEAEFSMPLEAMMPNMKGRFLNGTAKMNVAVRNGTIVTDLDRLEVKGQAVTGPFLDMMRKNFTLRPDPNETSGKLARNIEKVEIEDNKLILIPKTPAK